jgi:hypothetical protein
VLTQALVIYLRSLFANTLLSSSNWADLNSLPNAVCIFWPLKQYYLFYRFVSPYVCFDWQIEKDSYRPNVIRDLAGSFFIGANATC